jgi:hypothetical protein
LFICDFLARVSRVLGKSEMDLEEKWSALFASLAARIGAYEACRNLNGPNQNPRER